MKQLLVILGTITLLSSCGSGVLQKEPMIITQIEQGISHKYIYTIESSNFDITYISDSLYNIGDTLTFINTITFTKK